MTRGWILFATLVLSVIFRLWNSTATGEAGFIFSQRRIPVQTWVYFTMEHIIAIGVALCIIIHDNTPRWIFLLFIGILVLDLIHYLAVYRDEGIGFNLVKVLLFAIPFLWTQLKPLLTR